MLAREKLARLLAHSFESFDTQGLASHSELEKYGSSRRVAIKREDPVADTSPPFHVLSGEIPGGLAVEVEGLDGEIYCVVDATALNGEPTARSNGYAVVRRAGMLVSRQRRPQG